MSHCGQLSLSFGSFKLGLLVVTKTFEDVWDEVVGRGAEDEEEVGVEGEDRDKGGAVLEGEASVHGLLEEE